MLQENWIEFKGEKLFKSKLPEVENSYPINSIENSALSFSQLWLSNTSTFIQRSSGSTGTPSLHKIQRFQMQESAASTIKTLGLQAGDTALLSISADFIGGKMMIVRALEHGINLIVGEVSSGPLSSLKKDRQIDFFSFVPYQLSKLLEVQTEGSIEVLNNAKAIILGGAPVSETLAQSINKLIKAPVYSTYGMTETVSHVALKRINGTEDNYFIALDGITFSQDHRNCLVIHAPHITGVDALHSNDVVRLINKNHFQWLGRYDFVINSGGIKLHPEQIELKIEKLLKAEGILNEFFVFGQADEKLGSRLSLIIESAFDKDLIKQILKNGLSPYEIPRAIFESAGFIKTKSDKLDRKATLKKFRIDYI